MRMLPRTVGLAVAAALAWFATGCASTTLDTTPAGRVPDIAPGASLAVVPFENLSAFRHAGLAAADVTASVVEARDYFRVVEAGSLQDNAEIRFRRLETAPWERQVGANSAAAAAVGRSLKAQYVLAGAVDEFGFVDGFGETATVGVTLRLVRCVDGEVLWSGSLSRRVASVAFSEESAHRLLHRVIQDLVGRLTRDLQARHGAAPAAAAPAPAAK